MIFVYDLLQATDADEGLNAVIEYKLSDPWAEELFDLDPENGTLTTRVPLDRERTPMYTLHVLAQDRGQPRRSSRKTLTVHLSDINDNAPVITAQPYRISLPEGATHADFLQVQVGLPVTYSLACNEWTTDWSTSMYLKRGQFQSQDQDA